MIDWTECHAVETIPGKLSGQPVRLALVESSRCSSVSPRGISKWTFRARPEGDCDSGTGGSVARAARFQLRAYSAISAS